MKFTLGFSPCPNDTFIFDALVNGKIETEGLEFNVKLEDVQTLNDWALQGKLDITKLSYAVLPSVLDKYKLLQSGSALGKGVGPLLISFHEEDDAKIDKRLIALPGEHTTAHLLFKLKYPNAHNKIFIRYDQIESFVKEGKGLGVIIHENRFTYESHGLKKIADLGDHWESHTGVPIPLGGITVKRSIDREIQLKIDALIKKSIEYAFSNYPNLTDYIRQHSQEMEEDVMRKHIDLYVNEYSITLGEQGRNAVEKLIQVSGTAVKNDRSIFVE